VAAAVILDSGSNRFGNRTEIRDKLIHCLALPVRDGRNGDVEVGHVGLVMLVVVQVHGGSVEAGLERVIGVGQCREREGPVGAAAGAAAGA
jgi:hypothetical protein